uniref:Uncharacterized protein n=1 Tax=Micromonas pusilla TaxID=38833 RepID=A0A7S0I6V9_MICPS|mmetsp:Transcript_10096/g.41659  ORF Transcript_10096/g.41659 Transcript_10096/m.41659 type:complete len:126 (+) Transcript_10096:305-682(+)
MPPKKRKQDDSDAEATDAKPKLSEIDQKKLRTVAAFSYISRCTIEELDQVLEAVDRRQDRLLLLAANAFKPGDTVTWTDKSGNQVGGTVKKVNQKTVKVTTHGPYSKQTMEWTISPILLKKVERK